MLLEVMERIFACFRSFYISKFTFSFFVLCGFHSCGAISFQKFLLSAFRAFQILYPCQNNVLLMSMKAVSTSSVHFFSNRRNWFGRIPIRERDLSCLYTRGQQMAEFVSDWEFRIKERIDGADIWSGGLKGTWLV